MRKYGAVIFAICVGLMAEAESIAGQNEISLLQYVDIVLNQSLEAQSINDRLRSAELSLDSAGSAYAFQWVPSVNISNSENVQTRGAGISVERQSTFGTKFSLGARYNRIKSGSDVSESPVVFGRVEQGLFRNWGEEAGRYRLNKAELGNQRDRWIAIGEKQNLIRKAVQQYFAVILAQERVTISNNNLKRALSNLEISQSRYELGLVPKTDIYRAELAQLSILDALERDKNRLLIQKRQFVDLVNGQVSQVFEISVKDILFTRPTLPSNFALSYQLRSDWQTFKIDLADLTLDLKNAKRQLLPDIKLYVSGEKYGNADLAGNFDSSDDIDWRFGLTYSTPLSLAEERNNVELVNIQLNALERNQVAIERRIQQQILDAYDTATSAKRRLDIANERVKQAEKAAELAEIRFQRGLASNLDLIDAENELQNARNQALQQMVDLNLTVVIYARRSGVLDFRWLEENIVYY